MATGGKDTLAHNLFRCLENTPAINEATGKTWPRTAGFAFGQLESIDLSAIEHRFVCAAERDRDCLPQVVKLVRPCHAVTLALHVNG